MACPRTCLIKNTDFQNFHVCGKNQTCVGIANDYLNYHVCCFLPHMHGFAKYLRYVEVFPIETDMTMSMEFNLDFVNPNEEKYLGENEEVDGVKHPNSEEKSNKCSQRDNESSQAGQLRTI